MDNEMNENQYIRFINVLWGHVAVFYLISMSAQARKFSCGPQPTHDVPLSAVPQLFPAIYVHYNKK